MSKKCEQKNQKLVKSHNIVLTADVPITFLGGYFPQKECQSMFFIHCSWFLIVI